MTSLRRWGVWAASLVVIVAALAIGFSKPEPTSLAARTRALAGQVRCPVCQGETAAQSGAPAAIAIRTQIGNELAAGVAPATVLADLERSYGPTILERPPVTGVNLLVWVGPAALAGGGVALLAVAFVRWRRSLLVTQP